MIAVIAAADIASAELYLRTYRVYGLLHSLGLATKSGKSELDLNGAMTCYL